MTHQQRQVLSEAAAFLKDQEAGEWFYATDIFPDRNNRANGQRRILNRLGKAWGLEVQIEHGVPKFRSSVAIGNRVRFEQAESWLRHGTNPYSQEHCCYCSYPTGSKAAHLMMTRTNDGEWWLVDSLEPKPADESQFGPRFTLPVGTTCLKEHPEWCFAVAQKNQSIPRRLQDASEVSGVIGPDGNVYSDADPGL